MLRFGFNRTIRLADTETTNQAEDATVFDEASIERSDSRILKPGRPVTARGFTTGFNRTIRLADTETVAEANAVRHVARFNRTIRLADTETSAECDVLQRAAEASIERSDSRILKRCIRRKSLAQTSSFNRTIRLADTETRPLVHGNSDPDRLQSNDPTRGY